MITSRIQTRGGGGGVLWYCQTYIGSGHFLVKNLNFNIFGGFQKIKKIWLQKFYEYFFFFFWGGGGVITQLYFI